MEKMGSGKWEVRSAKCEVKANTLITIKLIIPTSLFLISYSLFLIQNDICILISRDDVQM
jgi:hypothetical protein